MLLDPGRLDRRPLTGPHLAHFISYHQFTYGSHLSCCASDPVSRPTGAGGAEQDQLISLVCAECDPSTVAVEWIGTLGCIFLSLQRKSEYSSIKIGDELMSSAIRSKLDLIRAALVFGFVVTTGTSIAIGQGWTLRGGGPHSISTAYRLSRPTWERPLVTVGPSSRRQTED